MPSDYERACEIVGVTSNCRISRFVVEAIEWLLAKCDQVTFGKLATVYTITTERTTIRLKQRFSQRSGDTLTEALTAAVLAVGENDAD